MMTFNALYLSQHGNVHELLLGGRVGWYIVNDLLYRTREWTLSSATVEVE